MEAWWALPGRQRWMLAALALLLAAVQIEQLYPQTAPLHHLPTLALLLASPFLMRRWPLSTPALACILIFLALHTIGARWTYSNVPYDALARALTGGTISEAFGLSRNHYDRLVHLSYGLLAVLPMREVLTRHVGLSQKLGVYLAVESVLAVSALYEIFEWLLTLSMAGEIADRYNGQQGDMWDAQKDMAMAAIGALVAAAWQGRGEWRRR